MASCPHLTAVGDGERFRRNDGGMDLICRESRSVITRQQPCKRCLKRKPGSHRVTKWQPPLDNAINNAL